MPGIAGQVAVASWHAHNQMMGGVFFRIKHKSIFQVVLKVKLVLYGFSCFESLFFREKNVTFVSKNT